MVMNLVGDLERFLLVMTIYQFGILSKISPINGSMSHQKCSGVIKPLIVTRDVLTLMGGGLIVPKLFSKAIYP